MKLLISSRLFLNFLDIKFVSYIFFSVCLYFHNFFNACFFVSSSTALSQVAYNVRRLDVVAASTTLAAGDKRSNLYKIVCGVTAAITPNRSLEAAHFCRIVRFTRYASQFKFRRYQTKFSRLFQFSLSISHGFATVSHTNLSRYKIT